VRARNLRQFLHAPGLPGILAFDFLHRRHLLLKRLVRSWFFYRAMARVRDAPPAGRSPRTPTGEWTSARPATSSLTLGEPVSELPVSEKNPRPRSKLHPGPSTPLFQANGTQGSCRPPVQGSPDERDPANPSLGTCLRESSSTAILIPGSAPARPSESSAQVHYNKRQGGPPPPPHPGHRPQRVPRL